MPYSAACRLGVSTLQWVLDAYNLTYASFILTGGVFGDLFGRRRLFVLGIALFTLASLLCALAPKPSDLIAGRALSGLGSALQLSGALAILTTTFGEGPERTQAISIWGGFNGLAMATESAAVSRSCANASRGFGPSRASGRRLRQVPHHSRNDSRRKREIRRQGTLRRAARAAPSANSCRGHGSSPGRTIGE